MELIALKIRYMVSPAVDLNIPHKITDVLFTITRLLDIHEVNILSPTVQFCILWSYCKWKVLYLHMYF